jgi:hypothetical protein
VRLRPVIAFSGVPGALWAAPGPKSRLGSALNTVPDDKLHRRPEEAPAPASTRECPVRVGAIPIQATRCPRRTSQLAQRWVRPGHPPGGVVWWPRAPGRHSQPQQVPVPKAGFWPRPFRRRISLASAGSVGFLVIRRPCLDSLLMSKAPACLVFREGTRTVWVAGTHWRQTRATSSTAFCLSPDCRKLCIAGRRLWTTQAGTRKYSRARLG